MHKSLSTQNFKRKYFLSKNKTKKWDFNNIQLRRTRQARNLVLTNRKALETKNNDAKLVLVLQGKDPIWSLRTNLVIFFAFGPSKILVWCVLNTFVIKIYPNKSESLNTFLLEYKKLDQTGSEQLAGSNPPFTARYVT